jgi:hypothetical protein
MPKRSQRLIGGVLVVLVGAANLQATTAAKTTKVEIAAPAAVAAGNTFSIKVTGLIAKDIVTVWSSSNREAKQRRVAQGAALQVELSISKVGQSQLLASVKRGTKTFAAHRSIRVDPATAITTESTVQTTVQPNPTSSISSTTSVVPTTLGQRAKLNVTGMSSGQFIPIGSWFTPPILPLLQQVFLAPDGNSFLETYYADQTMKLNLLDLRTGTSGSPIDSYPSPANSVKISSVLVGRSAEILSFNTSSWPGINREVGVSVDVVNQRTSVGSAPFVELSRDGLTAVLWKDRSSIWVRLPSDERPIFVGPNNETYEQNYSPNSKVSADGNQVLFHRIVSFNQPGTYVRDMVKGRTVELEAPQPDLFSGRYGEVLSGDGQTVLMFTRRGGMTESVEFVDTTTGKSRSKVLVSNAAWPRLSFDGSKAVVVERGQLWVVRDDGSHELVFTQFTKPVAEFQLSDDFATLYFNGSILRIPADSPIRR